MRGEHIRLSSIDEDFPTNRSPELAGHKHAQGSTDVFVEPKANHV